MTVTRLPVRPKPRLVRVTVHQQIQGVVQDLEALPIRPSASDVLALAERLVTIAERIEGGA